MSHYDLCDYIHSLPKPYNSFYVKTGICYFSLKILFVLVYFTAGLMSNPIWFSYCMYGIKQYDHSFKRLLSCSNEEKGLECRALLFKSTIP